MPGKHPQQPGPPRGADSGDESGRGRARREASDVFPQQRNAGEFGTHGGPNRKGREQKKDGGDGD